MLIIFELVCISCYVFDMKILAGYVPERAMNFPDIEFSRDFLNVVILPHERECVPGFLCPSHTHDEKVHTFNMKKGKSSVLGNQAPTHEENHFGNEN